MSCMKSDDLVISAALHQNGIRRYRMTLNDDCREGLQQYEFGFKKDALQMEGGGHYKKYYTCTRAISAFQLLEKPLHYSHPKCPVIETVFSSTLAFEQTARKENWTMSLIDTEHWPYLDFSYCQTEKGPPSGVQKKDATGLAILLLFSYSFFFSF